MIKTQLTTDKLAMTLSLACVVHCFFVPSFLILSYSVLSFSIDNEFIHKLIVLMAIPISTYALVTGYLNHKTTLFLFTGTIGLFVLSLAVILGESNLGELGEKSLTLLGSLMIAFSHYRNYQVCKSIDCTCHE